MPQQNRVCSEISPLSPSFHHTDPFRVSGDYPRYLGLQARSLHRTCTHECTPPHSLHGSASEFGRQDHRYVAPRCQGSTKHLGRLMRAMASYRMLSEAGPGVYVANDTTRTLALSYAGGSLEHTYVPSVITSPATDSC